MIKTQAFKSGCPLLEAFLFPSSTVRRTTYVAQTTATQLLPIQDSAGCIPSERKPHQTDKHYGWQQLMIGYPNRTMCAGTLFFVAWRMRRCVVVSRGKLGFFFVQEKLYIPFPNSTMCAPLRPTLLIPVYTCTGLSSDFFSPHVWTHVETKKNTIFISTSTKLPHTHTHHG
jgi:hypothetical protein